MSDRVAYEWPGMNTEQLVGALWCAGPVPEAVIEEAARRLRKAEAVEATARAVAKYWDKGDDPDANYPLITELKQALAR